MLGFGFRPGGAEKRGSMGRWTGLGAAVAVLMAAGSAAVARPALGQEEASDPAKPQRHFRVERPADLSDADALSVYSRILDDMVAGYRLSGDTTARDFRAWRRFNKAPYRSQTHGERFVNNYGNATAKAYGAYEKAGSLPVGSILAKDSFAVTSSGDVFTGPLFLMEKMPAGFNAASRDWRYSMIMPDGSLFGVTGGSGSARVEFCITCHQAAGDERDHLFFMPEAYRVRILRLND